MKTTIEPEQAKTIIDQLLDSFPPGILISGLRTLMDSYFLSPDTDGLIDPETGREEKQDLYDQFTVLSKMLTKIDRAMIPI